MTSQVPSRLRGLFVVALIIFITGMIPQTSLASRTIRIATEGDPGDGNLNPQEESNSSGAAWLPDPDPQTWSGTDSNLVPGAVGRSRGNSPVFLFPGMMILVSPQGLPGPLFVTWPELVEISLSWPRGRPSPSADRGWNNAR